MARDPQQLRKAYEYKLGKDLADKLSDAQIASLSNYYNRAPKEEQSKIDSELIKGMGDFLDSARDLAKEGFIRDPKLPVQKYKKVDLDEVKAKEEAFTKYKAEDKAKDDLVESVDKKLDEKLGETSDSIMSEIDKLIADYQKKVVDIQKSRQQEEEKVPEGLDDLLKDIRSEVGGDTPKRGGALAVIPKPSPSQKGLVGDEDIDPEILKALGVGDVTDLDYGEYQSLLREKMMANQMGSGEGLDQEKLKKEFKRVQGKSGTFKVKTQPKITPSSFVSKTKPSTAVKKVTPLLPGSMSPEEVEQPIQPERQGMDKTLALIAEKLNQVDNNVKETTDNLRKKDKSEAKAEQEENANKQRLASQQREKQADSPLAIVPKLVKNVVKPVQDLLAGFFEFLKKIGFAMFIVEMMKFLKNPAEYINGIVKALNDQISKLEKTIESFVKNKLIIPMNTQISNLNTEIGKFIDQINPMIRKLDFLDLGIPEIDKDKVQIPLIDEDLVEGNVNLGRIPEVPDNLLGGGTDNNFGQPETSPANPPGTPRTDRPDRDERPQNPPRTPRTDRPDRDERPQVTPQEPLMGPQQNAGVKGLLDFISKGEGGYNSMNQGTQGDQIVGSTHNAKGKLGKDLTQMTIGEIMDRQDYLMNPSNPQVGDYGIFAAGRYQIIPSTMKDILPGSGLSRSDMFSEENQDKLGMALITNKQPRVEAYLKGQGSLDGALDALSDEFASMPDPRTGNSKYGAGNRALHSVEEVTEALQRARKGYGDQSSMVTPPMSQQVARVDPQVAVPSPPVMQTASMTNLGGDLTSALPGGDSNSAAGEAQSVVNAFSASDPSNLSVIMARSVYGVVV